MIKLVRSQTYNDYEAEVNKVNLTLKPDKGKKTGKIGIFLFGQVGDIATAMSVLKYRKQLWPNKEIVWFVNPPNVDLLKYSPVDEIRPYGWAGNGMPEGSENYYPMLCTADNKLNQTLKLEYELTHDLEEGYFPAPHMIAPENRHGIDYPNCSRKVFGVDMNLAWHPYLSHSNEERTMVKDFMKNLPKGRNILIETFAGSGQSPFWTHDTTLRVMQVCNEKWGDCNFIFASHKYYRDMEQYPDGFFGDRVVSCAHLTPRQCGLINNYCDLMICVSSGISCTTSCWGNVPVPKVQLCGSFICSTVSLANGPIELVTTDDMPVANRIHIANIELEKRLVMMLEKYK